MQFIVYKGKEMEKLEVLVLWHRRSGATIAEGGLVTATIFLIHQKEYRTSTLTIAMITMNLVSYRTSFMHAMPHDPQLVYLESSCDHLSNCHHHSLVIACSIHPVHACSIHLLHAHSPTHPDGSYMD